VVKIEGARQPGTHLDGRCGVVIVRGKGIFGQKLAADALMIAFGVVMSDVFTNEMSQVGLAKNDEVIEALIPNGLDEAFSVRIAVRALRRYGNAADAAAGEEKFPLFREQRIAVVHQGNRWAKPPLRWRSGGSQAVAWDKRRKNQNETSFTICGLRGEVFWRQLWQSESRHQPDTNGQGLLGKRRQTAAEQAGWAAATRAHPGSLDFVNAK